MSRKPGSVDLRTLESLRALLRKKMQLECSNNAEIHLLHDRIRLETGELLSVQTLNRFFGLIKYHFAPAADTLNILCRFLGYAGFNEFKQVNPGNPSAASAGEEAEILLIQALLADLRSANPQDPSLTQLFRNLFKICNLKPGLWNQLYSRLAAFPVGQRYLFEQFINMDALNGHYGNGLEFYLLHASLPAQQVFAHTLLLQRYFLIQKPTLFHHHQLILERLYAGRETSLHNWTAGQFIAAEIYTAAFNGQVLPAPGYLLSKATVLNVQQDTYPMFPCLEYLIGEAYVLAGAFEEAYQVLSGVSNKEIMGQDGFDKGYEVQYRLLRLLSGFFSGAKSRQLATLQFEELSAMPVQFLSVHYFALFKNMLRMALSGPSVQELLLKERADLVERTGFSRFLNLEPRTCRNKGNSLMEING